MTEKQEKGKTYPLQSSILISFILTLCVGTLLRILFIGINITPITLSEVFRPLLVGIVIDSFVLSLLFFPTCFALFFHSSWVQKVQYFYLYSVISLFILMSFIDIFFFQVFHDRIHIYALQQASEIPLPQILNMIFYEYSYGLLILPFTFVLAWLLSRWSISYNQPIQNCMLPIIF